jgi:hypothetical protein
VATLEDAEPILEYIKNLKAGQYDSDPRVPKYCDLFSDENIADYITRVSPSYVIEGVSYLRLSCYINAFIFCVHYLCLIGVYVFYVGDVDKSI